MVKTAPETAPASPPSPAAARSAPGTPTAGGGGGAAAPAPASSAPPPAAAAPAAPAPAAAGVFKSFHSKIGASLVRAMSVTKADGGAGGGGGGGDGPPSARGQPPAGLGGDVALYGQQAGPRPGAGGPLAAAANALLQSAQSERAHLTAWASPKAASAPGGAGPALARGLMATSPTAATSRGAAVARASTTTFAHPPPPHAARAAAAQQLADHMSETLTAARMESDVQLHAALRARLLRAQAAVESSENGLLELVAEAERTRQAAVRADGATALAGAAAAEARARAQAAKAASDKALADTAAAKKEADGLAKGMQSVGGGGDARPKLRAAAAAASAASAHTAFMRTLLSETCDAADASNAALQAALLAKADADHAAGEAAAAAASAGASLAHARALATARASAFEADLEAADAALGAAASALAGAVDDIHRLRSVADMELDALATEATAAAAQQQQQQASAQTTQQLLLLQHAQSPVGAIAAAPASTASAAAAAVTSVDAAAAAAAAVASAPPATPPPPPPRPSALAAAAAATSSALVVSPRGGGGGVHASPTAPAGHLIPSSPSIPHPAESARASVRALEGAHALVGMLLARAESNVRALADMRHALRAARADKGAGRTAPPAHPAYAAASLRLAAARERAGEVSPEAAAYVAYCDEALRAMTLPSDAVLPTAEPAFEAALGRLDGHLALVGRRHQAAAAAALATRPSARLPYDLFEQAMKQLNKAAVYLPLGPEGMTTLRWRTLLAWAQATDYAGPPPAFPAAAAPSAAAQGGEGEGAEEGA